MITRILLLACVLCFVAACSDGAHQAAAENDAADSAQVMASERTEPGTVFVTYFHGGQRCATCLKLEAYSREAVEDGFAGELADSSLVWRTVNYDQQVNEHYIKDYGLFTKAVILTRVVDGEDVEWKNLDEIWDRVGDKEDFVAYVQEDLRLFLHPAENRDG